MSGADATEGWFYADASGTERGPVNFRVVRANLRIGSLTLDSLVWKVRVGARGPGGAHARPAHGVLDACARAPPTAPRRADSLRSHGARCTGRGSRKCWPTWQPPPRAGLAPPSALDARGVPMT